MREFFTIAIFKIKADIRMNKTTLNSQKEKHSILSLRRATALMSGAAKETEISIHALLAESDKIPFAVSELVLEFLSTLSLRRATRARVRARAAEGHFYPRSPCGERLPRNLKSVAATPISIHALLAESDLKPRLGTPM